MKDTIDQFMWGFQQHFRAGVEREIERALNLIGLPVDVRVVLVGFAAGARERHSVCVEPEDGPLTVDHLADIPARAASILQADPESRITVSDPRHRLIRERSLSRGARASALVDTIEASAVFPGLKFFASESSPIAGYEVHTCVGVPRDALESAPALAEDTIDRVYVGRSLQHEVLTGCLGRADAALHLPDPGSGLHVLNAGADEIVRAAASRFVDGIVYRLTGTPADLYHAVNDFVSLGYERAPAGGRLVIQPPPAAGDLSIQFRRPIRLSDARIMRKLLELSDGNASVITDGGRAFGLEQVASSPEVGEIAVVGHAEWQIGIDGVALVRVSYGTPSLPKPFLSRARFHDVAQRVVGSVDLDAIWATIEAGQAAGHGTTLVVSTEPDHESVRLGGQAVPIVPTRMNRDEVARVARVDGALLLGTDARCHAFGVILDGLATGAGDPARGSRYNSAVRYQLTCPTPALAVVVSDDGTIDLIPDLRPRVHRQDVESAVLAFVTICQEDDPEGERFAEAHDNVMRLAFYLDEEQCRQVTASYESEMQRRFDAGGIRLSAPRLEPHPDMDDSYFL